MNTEIFATKENIDLSTHLTTDYQEKNINYPITIDMSKYVDLPDILKLPEGVEIIADMIDGDKRYSAVKDGEVLFDGFNTLAGIITVVQENNFIITPPELEKSDIWTRPDQLQYHVIGVNTDYNYLIGRLYDALPSKSGTDLIDKVRYALVLNELKEMDKLCVVNDLARQHDFALYHVVGDVYEMDKPSLENYVTAIPYLTSRELINLDENGNITPGVESYDILDKKCMDICRMFDQDHATIQTPKMFIVDLYSQFPMNMSVGYTRPYEAFTGDKLHSDPGTFYVLDLTKGPVVKNVKSFDEAMTIAGKMAPQHVPYHGNIVRDETVRAARPYNEKEQADHEQQYKSTAHVNFGRDDR